MADNAAVIDTIINVKAKDSASGPLGAVGKAADKAVSSVDKLADSIEKTVPAAKNMGQAMAAAHNAGEAAAKKNINAVNATTQAIERQGKALEATAESARRSKSIINAAFDKASNFDMFDESKMPKTPFERAINNAKSLGKTLFDVAQNSEALRREESKYLSSLENQFARTTIGAIALLGYITRMQHSMTVLDVQAASLNRIFGAGSSAWATQQLTSSMMQDAIGTAYKYGASISDVAGTMVEFARQGRSQFEIQYLTSELGELRLMLASSTGEFLSMSQAMKTATTLMTQMDLTVYEAVDALKLMAEYDIRAATSFDQISTAMNRFASAGKVAGMSTKEIIEVATAFTEIGIGGSRAGTALNTIISRTRNQKQAIEMLQELGVQTIALRDGTYQATSAMEQLLEAYRKVMASGDSQLIRRYGTVFAGTRLQSVLFAGMQRLNKQTRSPLDIDDFTRVTNDLENKLKTELKNIDITTGINIKSKVNIVDMDPEQVRTTITKGIDTLIASLRAEYNEKKSVHIPDSVSLVRQWFDVPTNQARAIVQQYSGLFEQISLASEQYLNQTESSYARIVRLAESTSESIQRDRERALASMTDTLSVAQSRMKTTLESIFYNNGFIDMLQQGIETATQTLTKLLSGGLTAIKIPLTIVGFGDVERGIRNLGMLVEMYLTNRVVVAMTRMVKGGVEAFGKLVSSWAESWDRIRQHGSKTPFIFNDEQSRSSTFEYLNEQVAVTRSSILKMNTDVGQTIYQMQLAERHGENAFSNMANNISKLSVDLKQVPTHLKNIEKHFQAIQDMERVAAQRQGVAGYEMGANAWRVTPQGYSQSDIAIYRNISAQENWRSKVAETVRLMRQAEEWNTKKPQEFANMVQRINDNITKTEALSARVNKNLNRWIIPDHTKQALRGMPMELDAIKKGFETARAQALALSRIKVTPGNIQQIQKAYNDLNNFMASYERGMSQISDTTNRVFGSMSGMVTKFVVSLSNIIGTFTLITVAGSMLWQTYKKIVGWTVNLTMETDKMTAAYKRARQSWNEWQQSLKSLKANKENTENVFGQILDNINKFNDMPGVAESLAPIIREFTVEPKLKTDHQAYRALDKFQDEYINYVTSYLNKVKVGGKEFVENNPLKNEAEYLAERMKIAEDQRATFIEQVESIYLLMGHNIRQDAEIARNAITGYIRDQMEAATILEDTQKQLDELRNMYAKNVTGDDKGKVSLADSITTLLGKRITYQSKLADAGMIPSEEDNSARKMLIDAVNASTELRLAMATELNKFRAGLTMEEASAQQLGQAMQNMVFTLADNQAASVRLAEIESELADKYGNQAQKERAKVRLETAKQIQDASDKVSQQKSEIDQLSVIMPNTQIQNKIDNIERLTEQNRRRIEDLQDIKADLESELNEAMINEDKDLATELRGKIIANIEEQMAIIDQQLVDTNTQIQEAIDQRLQEMLRTAAGFTEAAQDDILANLDALIAEADGKVEVQEQLLAQRKEIEAQFTEIAKIAAEYARTIANAKDDEARKAAEAEALAAMNKVATSMFQARDTILEIAKKFGLKVLGEADTLFNKIASGISKLFGGAGLKVDASSPDLNASVGIDNANKIKALGAAAEAAQTAIRASISNADKASKDLDKQRKAMLKEIDKWKKQQAAADKPAKTRGGGGGGRGNAEKDLLQQLASEHAERMSALEISFRTIKDSEGNIIEYLDRTGTVDYMRAQIEEIKHYEQELAKVLSRLKEPKEIAKTKQAIEKAALQRVKLEWEIQLKLNAAKKQELEHEIDLLRKRAEMNIDLFGTERRNALLDKIWAKEKEIHDMRMAEAKGDPIKERAAQIDWENKLLSRQEQIVKNITQEFKKQIELKNRKSPLDTYDREFRLSNPQYFTPAHKHLEYGLQNIADALDSGTQQIQQNMEAFAAKMAAQRQEIELSDMSDEWKQTALDQLKANSIDGIKAAMESADKEIQDALDNFNMDRILPGQKIHDPILGETFGTSFRDRKELLEKARETIDQKIEEITQMFRDAGFSEEEINSAELQEIIRAYGDKYAEYFKKELEALDKSRQMLMEEVKSALISGWDEGFNIGIEHGFTKEGYKALLKNMKMTVARSVSQGIQKLIADQMTQAITSFFNDTMDGVGSILGQSLGGILAPMISGLIGNVIGFLIGGLFSDWVNEMEEEQLKQQRDAINAQGFTWSYSDPSVATPYYEFQPPVSSESVKIVKLNSVFNITTDAALAMSSHRRELERVVTELFTAWTREASKVVGARV